MGSVFSNFFKFFKRQRNLSVNHSIIDKKECLGKTILIIGDVHGCLDELKELLEVVGYEPSSFLNIFCGDLVNKGPKSIETLDFIKDLPHSYSVRGNHEDHVLKVHQNLKSGVTTETELKLSQKWIAKIRPEHLTFIKSMPYTLTIPYLDAVCVHAGIVPGVALVDQSLHDLTHMRNVVSETCAAGSEKSVGAEHIDIGRPWASLWDGPEHVYFGHDAIRGLQKYPHATGLDTGCVYGKKLTAAVFDRNRQSRLVSVNAKQIYKNPTK